MEKLTEAQITEELNKILEPGNAFTCESVQHVNFKPHPYMIGPGHLLEGHMYLGEAEIKEAEGAGVHCYDHGCRIPYDQHTSDFVAFLRLKHNVANAEAANQLMLVKPFAMEQKIDGFGFIDDGFRILAPENKEKNGQTV